MHHYAATPTALYGVVLLCCGVAYTILERALIREQGRDSRLAAAVGDGSQGDRVGRDVPWSRSRRPSTSPSMSRLLYVCGRRSHVARPRFANREAACAAK